MSPSLIIRWFVKYQCTRSLKYTFEFHPSPSRKVLIASWMASFPLYGCCAKLEMSCFWAIGSIHYNLLLQIILQGVINSLHFCVRYDFNARSICRLNFRDILTFVSVAITTCKYGLPTCQKCDKQPPNYIGDIVNLNSNYSLTS